MNNKELDHIFRLFQNRNAIKRQLETLLTDHSNYHECTKTVKIYADYNRNEKHVIASDEEVGVILSLLIEKYKTDLKEIENEIEEAMKCTKKSEIV